MMTKPYLYKNRFLQNKKKPKLFFVVLYSLIFFIFVSFIFPSFFTNTLQEISKPIWKFKTEIVDKSVLNSITSFFYSKNSLLEENKNLKNKLLGKDQKLIEFNLLQSENKRLRSALNMTTNKGATVFAYILAKPNQTPYDSLILDAGLIQGVRVGDLVRSGKSIILGEIVKVQNKTSNAQLFSSPGIKSDIVIGDTLGAVAEGIGGNNFKIKLPRDIIVKEGMSVKLARFPSTLIGFVDAIQKDDSDSFQKVFVRSPINVSNIGDVFIVHLSE